MSAEPTFAEQMDAQDAWLARHGDELRRAVKTETDPETRADLALSLRYLQLRSVMTPARFAWLDGYLAGRRR